MAEGVEEWRGGRVEEWKSGGADERRRHLCLEEGGEAVVAEGVATGRRGGEHWGVLWWDQ